MAVDRGGLSYTIQIRDQFSKTTAKFKSEMRSSKAAFAEFQKGAAAQKDSAAAFKKTSKGIDIQAESLKKLAAEAKRQTAVEREAIRIRNTQQRESTKAIQSRLAAERAATKERAKLLLEEQRNLKASIDAQNRQRKQAERLEQARRKDEARALADQQKQLKAFADAQTRREKEAARIHAAMQKDQAIRKKADPEVQAQKRLNDALREETIQRKQIAILRAKAQTQFAQGDLLGGAKSLKAARTLQTQLESIGKTGNSLFFTFRRLVGVLAVFTIARNVVQGFQDLVKAGIEFDDKVQSATISIAGLLVAVADVRNEFGQSVTPAEQLGLAMGAARDQVKKLRQDALTTVGTFQQLLEVFQIAVAPGFAAGLNLDQIRKLAVSISQAAAALGVSQDQLSEEIRSLLSGTIQARTTRIATSLGITNADIRRLKEAGTLAEFLQAQLAPFAASAREQARGTIEGITSNITDALQAILGGAAKPLFDELINLGNEFFDKVLTIKDLEGNLVPNPEVVKGFEAIFNALRDGIQQLREVAKGLGFKGLQNTFSAIGVALSTGIQFAIGFAQTLLVALNAVVVAVRTIADFFGLTVGQIGKVAGAFGAVIAATLLWDNTLGKIGIRFGDIFSVLKAIIPGLGSLQAAALSLSGALKTGAVVIAQLAAVVGVVIVGFDQILGSVFDLNLTLTETVSLLGRGIAAQIKESIKGFKAIGIVIGDTFSGASIDETKEKLGALADELRADELAFNKEIADIIAKAAGREARGAGFDPAFDFKNSLAAANKAGTEFSGIISGADAEIAAMAGTIVELQDQIFTAGQEFRAAFNSQDLQGVGEKIQSVFSDSIIASAEKLRKLRRADQTVESSIAKLIEEQGISAERRAAIEKAASSDLKGRQAALKALNLTPAEGQLISLLRDEKDIREAITSFEEKSLELAFKKAAIIAVETSREMNREAVLLRTQLAAEQAITQVVASRLGQRRQAVVEAQNALNIAKVEAQESEKALQKQIDFLKQRLAVSTGPGSPTAAERSAFESLLTSLEDRADIEKGLTAEKLKQLEITRQEAALIESGTLTQGLQRGFEQLANDLPSAFEAGVTIVRSSVQALTDFISQSIVSAFDPTDDSSLQERFARFLQGIAQIILQQIIQLAIASALQKTLSDTADGAAQITTATTVASIKLVNAEAIAAIEIATANTVAGIMAASRGFGFHKGGIVKGYNAGGPVARAGKARTRAHAHASGYAAGGPQRPAGLHPSDTVPAWLQAGEFVIRKSAVDGLGENFFERINSGKFAVAASAPPSGAQAAASAGMAKGGLVSDQLQRNAVNTGSSNEDKLTVLPVQVAGERELDRIFAGGKTAARKFLQDNASVIRTIVGGK